jgi:hypothetical protein
MVIFPLIMAVVGIRTASGLILQVRNVFIKILHAEASNKEKRLEIAWVLCRNISESRHCKFRAGENSAYMSGSDFCIPRKETAWPLYFQHRIIMFCLPMYQ